MKRARAGGSADDPANDVRARVGEFDADGQVAKILGKPGTGGSDAHSTQGIGYFAATVIGFGASWLVITLSHMLKK